jgi:hypothetical protein
MSKLQDFLVAWPALYSIRLEFLPDNLWYASLVDRNGDIECVGPHQWPMVSSGPTPTLAVNLLEQMMENYS